MASVNIKSTGYEFAFRAKQNITNSGTLGRIYMDLRPAYKGTRVTSSTTLIADGFPRSANSYCYYALKYALRDVGEVRGHTHAGAVYNIATKRRIPSAALLRDPADAVSSYLQYIQRVSAAAALRGYSMFYESVLKHIDSVLILSFESVTQYFELVLGAIAGRFPDLAKIQTLWNGADDSRAREAVHQSHLARNSGSVDPTRVPLPRSERDTSRHNLITEVVSCSEFSRANQIFVELRKSSI